MKKFTFKAFETIAVYDYKDAVKSDIKQYLKENSITPAKIKKGLFDYDSIYSEIFVSDSVTGNASGSYWCNSYKAKCCLWGNTDLLEEACSEFDCKISASEETNDVSIRCYLCGEILSEIIAECKDGTITRF